MDSSLHGQIWFSSGPVINFLRPSIGTAGFCTTISVCLEIDLFGTFIGTSFVSQVQVALPLHDQTLHANTIGAECLHMAPLWCHEQLFADQRLLLVNSCSHLVCHFLSFVFHWQPLLVCCCRCFPRVSTSSWSCGLLLAGAACLTCNF